MTNKKPAKKQSKYTRIDIITGVIFILMGAAFTVVLSIIIQSRAPKEKIELCKDGWSREEKDGRIYETYIPENDTCKKRSESK